MTAFNGILPPLVAAAQETLAKAVLAADYEKINKSLRKGANPNVKMFGKFNVATVASALYMNENSRTSDRPCILPLLKQYGARPQAISSAEVTKLNQFAKTLRKPSYKKRGRRNAVRVKSNYVDIAKRSQSLKSRHAYKHRPILKAPKRSPKTRSSKKSVWLKNAQAFAVMQTIKFQREQRQAATRIEALVRGVLVRKRRLQAVTLVTRLQRMGRSWISRRREEERRWRRAREIYDLERAAAVKLQAFSRTMITKMHMKIKNRQATQLTRWFRGYRVRRRVWRSGVMVTMVQRVVRGRQHRKIAATQRLLSQYNIVCALLNTCAGAMTRCRSTRDTRELEEAIHACDEALKQYKIIVNRDSNFLKHGWWEQMKALDAQVEGILPPAYELLKEVTLSSKAKDLEGCVQQTRAELERIDKTMQSPPGLTEVRAAIASVQSLQMTLDASVVAAHDAGLESYADERFGAADVMQLIQTKQTELAQRYRFLVERKQRTDMLEQLEQARANASEEDINKSWAYCFDPQSLSPYFYNISYGMLTDVDPTPGVIRRDNTHLSPPLLALTRGVVAIQSALRGARARKVYQGLLVERSLERAIEKSTESGEVESLLIAITNAIEAGVDDQDVFYQAGELLNSLIESGDVDE